MTWSEEFDLLLLRAWKKGATDAAILTQMVEMRLPVSRADVIAARKRLGLRQRVLPPTPDQSPPPPKERPNPRLEATIWLGKRLVERPDGYHLDGRPINFYPDVVREINRRRKLAGVPQLDADPSWVV